MALNKDNTFIPKVSRRQKRDAKLAAEAKAREAEQAVLKRVRKLRRERKPAAHTLSPVCRAAGRGKLLRSGDYREAIKGLEKLKGRFVRDPDDFRPRSKNPDRQVAELARFLLAEYDVPGWLDASLKTWDRRGVAWFLHLGRGGNLRTAPHLPVVLTKKQAHHALAAPADLSPVQAVRWAVATDAGCRPTVAEAYATARRLEGFWVDEMEAFWATLPRWLADVAGPMFAPAQVGPVVDYLHAQRFEPAGHDLVGGRWRERPPARAARRSRWAWS